VRAVAAGGAEQLGTEVDLFLDGSCRCDQPAAHLVRACLLATARSGSVGQRVAAALTPGGLGPVLLRSTAASRSVMFSDRRTASSAGEIAHVGTAPARPIVRRAGTTQDLDVTGVPQRLPARQWRNTCGMRRLPT
jgi:hypothetical protein